MTRFVVLTPKSAAVYEDRQLVAAFDILDEEITAQDVEQLRTEPYEPLENQDATR